jgi:hypothetical protein
VECVDILNGRGNGELWTSYLATRLRHEGLIVFPYEKLEDEEDRIPGVYWADVMKEDKTLFALVRMLRAPSDKVVTSMTHVGDLAPFMQESVRVDIQPEDLNCLQFTFLKGDSAYCKVRTSLKGLGSLSKYWDDYYYRPEQVVDDLVQYAKEF